MFQRDKTMFRVWVFISALIFKTDGDLIDGKISLLDYQMDITDAPAKVLSFPPNLTEEADGNAVQVRVQNSGVKKRWKISLLLLNMTCYGDDHIRITSGTSPLSKTWCSNGAFDDSSDKTELLLDGYDRFSISVRGDWQFSSAQVLATVYEEAQGNCQCNGLFCCQNSCPTRNKGPKSLQGNNALSWFTRSFGSSSTYEKAGVNNTNLSTNRCISFNLRCDELPNCGLSCNGDYPDESNKFCIATTPSGENKKNSEFVRILTYVIGGVCGAFGIGFIVIFFVIYLYYRRKDWGLQRDSVRESKSVSVIGEMNERWSIDEEFAAQAAARRIHRLSTSKQLYCFEDT